ncbi:MAG: hypothetical protein Q8K52_06265 [Thiobacillus sp.]|nr:hypothetical protein [Thiobacillus sp.]
MTLRTLVIVAGLATLVGGCSTPSEPRQQDDRGYPHDHRVYRDTDSYEGYYYVRIIYINGDPWYVDDYRRVRPIPRHLHSHFQYSTWVRSLPPRFGREREMRDGYDLSRIVYINDVPHYVDDDRRTRAVPDRLHNRFEYRVVVPQQREGRRGDDRRGDERPRPSQRYDDRETRPVPPASGREQERQESSAHERERERETSLQDKARIGDDEPRRGRSQTPGGTEQDRGRSQTVSQPAKPAVDDRKTRTGATQGEERRTDTAAEKKNGKTKGRDRDERKMREEGEDRDGNTEDARKTRRE